MRVRPADPTWEGRDRFLLSVGHYAIAHYAILTEAGLPPRGRACDLWLDDSRLPMSGMTSYTPGTEMSGGSSAWGCRWRWAWDGPEAEGLVVVRLHADGRRRDGRRSHVGGRSSGVGLQAGQHHRLVDFNGVQADGPSMSVMRTEPLVDKFEAFGCLCSA